MTTIIISLLSLSFWNTIFATSFFFGLFFVLFVILGAIGSHSDADGSDHDVSDLDHDMPDLDHDMPDLDHDMPDLDHDMSDLDHDMPDLDHDIADLDHDIADLDHDMPDMEHEIKFHGETHIEIHQGEIGVDNESYFEESRYLMGNIAVFLVIFGQIGWLNIGHLTDLILLIAFIGGYLSSKAFAWFIANYAKTVINPIKHISKGDIGVVIYGVTPYKPGMVQVKRKDGVISTIIARGAFSHDIFEKREKGYIWSKDGGIYIITKGIRGQPDLKASKNQEKSIKSKLK